MALVFKWGKDGTESDRDNARVKGKSLAAFQDINEYYEGVEVNNLRAGVATELNKDGLIQEVGTDVLRFDYSENPNGDIFTEDSATNLLRGSNSFDTGVRWVAHDDVEVNSSTELSPDGTQNCFRVSGAVGTNRNDNVLQNNVSVSSSTDYASGMYVKSAGATKCRWYMFDASTGQSSNTEFALGSQWIRVNENLTSGGSTSIIQCYVGDTDGDILVWEGQLEEGDVLTSQIHTTDSSTATRAADTGITTGDISHLINSEEGVIEIRTAAIVGRETRISLSDGTSSNRIVIGFNAIASSMYLLMSMNGVSINPGNTVSIQDFTVKRTIRIKYKSGETTVEVDGIEVYSSVTSFSGAVLNKFSLDSSSGTTYRYSGRTEWVRIYDSADD